MRSEWWREVEGRSKKYIVDVSKVLLNTQEHYAGAQRTRLRSSGDNELASRDPFNT